MKELFALSCVLLWMLVVLEAMLLQEVLRRTVRFKRLYTGSPRRSRREQLSTGALSTGTLAPEFTAPVLGTDRTVSTSDLKGHSTILLFVSPGETSSPFYEKLSVGTHALWHKAGGHLYFVCSGGEQACRQIMRDHHVEGFGRGHVPVVLDEGRRIAQSFLITDTPQAVMLDEEGRVSRYGHPLSTGEVTDGND